MKKAADEMLKLKTHLQEELQAGNSYVAFNSEYGTFDIDEFFCFRKAYDAWEYCYENSTDYDIYGYRSITTCLKALDYGLEKAFHSVDVNNESNTNRLNNREGNPFAELLTQYFNEQQLETIKTKNMNTQNYEYLK